VAGSSDTVGVRAEVAAGQVGSDGLFGGSGRERCGLLLKSENFVPVSDRGGGYGG
jgi:hypothetical protein